MDPLFAAAFARAEPAFMLDYTEFPLDSIPLLYIDSTNGVTFRDVATREAYRSDKLNHTVTSST